MGHGQCVITECCAGNEWGIGECNVVWVMSECSVGNECSASVMWVTSAQ